MEINDVTAMELVENYGTPLFVYDAEKIREQYSRLEQAFGKFLDDFQIFFAVKSNFNPEIAEILVGEGAGLDCTSKAEVLLAEEIGAEKVLYTAPYNRGDELEFATEKDATINFDSKFLLDKLEEVPETVCFRIDPEVDDDHSGQSFAGGDTKFGVSEKEAVEVFREAKERGAESFGIHMMTGSNILDPDYFAQITEKLMGIAGETAEELEIEFEFVDIGGGLGIPYRPSQEELNIQETAEKVAENFNTAVQRYDMGDPQLRIEPGRYLVGQSGHLLTRVTGIKQKEDKEYVGIDTGMHHNIRPMLLDAYHELKLVNEPEGPVKQKKTVVGPVCSSTDVMAEERQLPEIEEGDILSIEDIGAYGFSMASHWNTRPLPAEIMIEKGEAKVIREREGLKDVFHGTKLEEKKE